MELVVVIAIITLLAGMLLPSMSKAREIVRANTTRSLLFTLDAAVNQFHSDTKDAFGLGREFYPPSNKSDADDDLDNIDSKAKVPSVNGRYLLTIFMTGYADDKNSDHTPSTTDLSDDDGLDGWGMLLKGKRNFGPYNGLQNAPMRDAGGNKYAFLDAFGNDVYYYRYDQTNDEYDASDNTGGTTNPTQDYLDELEKQRRDFLLITAGADKDFGDVDGSGNLDAEAKDNISNVKSPT